MRKSNIITSTRVWCSGHVHTISLTKSGALVLHDHPHLREELAFLALGGEPCRCLQILQDWKRKDADGIPEELRKHLRVAREKTRKRAAKRISIADPLTVPFAVRVVCRTMPVAQNVLALCAYRRARGRWVGGNHYITVIVNLPGITGYARRVRSEYGWWPGWDSYITASVPPTWLIRVYKRGLAVVDGMFVLDVLHENEHGILVLAGRQGRGFNVYPCPALVTRAVDGRYHIRRWLKKEVEIVCLFFHFPSLFKPGFPFL